MKRKLIIQRLKKLLLKIEIHPLTLLYFVLSIFSGYIKWYLGTMMIVIFHETCHLLMACYFHFDIEKIEILPFGAYLSLIDFYEHSSLENICVLLAGPCSHLLIVFLLRFIESSVFYEYMEMMNMLIFLFNLMPIYPLDGGRMIGIVLQEFMDLKESFYFHIKLSVMSLCLLTVFYLRINTLVVIVYLFIQQLIYYLSIPSLLRDYFIHISILYPRKRIIVHKALIYRRGYHNYYIRKNKIIDEKEMIYEFLENVK